VASKSSKIGKNETEDATIVTATTNLTLSTTTPTNMTNGIATTTSSPKRTVTIT